MATEAKKIQPIIVKKVKRGGHAVHGGAWKIAYADFVTAMMAFFLLMWLLGSTSEGDKKGISDYFSTPLKVAGIGGSGAGSRTSLINGGGSDMREQSGQSRKSDSKEVSKKDIEAFKAEQARQDAKRLSALSAKISALISTDPKLSQFTSQILIEITPDGLQIQIIDDQKRPMFDIGSAIVKPYMRDILRLLGAALIGVENKISLDGHTDQLPYGELERGYSNWELSADRANASRRELLTAGMPGEKLVRVAGMASTILLEMENPFSPTNRRISLVVLTSEAEERITGYRRSPI